MTKKLGLGKNLTNLGLKELLSGLHHTEVPVTHSTVSQQKLPVEFLHPGKYQPRRAFNQIALDELANSIRAQGLLQPIIVRKLGDKKYEIIAGERRWRAAQIAGLHEVPIILRELSDEQALAISLIENIQRENLNAIDEAEALQRLSDEFSLTHQEVAETVGKSRTTITNLLRLLALHSDVKDMLASGLLEMGHARAILALSVVEQVPAAQMVVAKKLSVRETEKLVHDLQHKIVNKVTAQSVDPNVHKLEKELGDKLGAKVVVQQSSRSKGRLVIYYNSLEELDGIIAHIN